MPEWLLQAMSGAGAMAAAGLIHTYTKVRVLERVLNGHLVDVETLKKQYVTLDAHTVGFAAVNQSLGELKQTVQELRRELTDERIARARHEGREATDAR